MLSKKDYQADFAGERIFLKRDLGILTLGQTHRNRKGEVNEKKGILSTKRGYGKAMMKEKIDF